MDFATHRMQHIKPTGGMLSLKWLGCEPQSMGQRLEHGGLLWCQGTPDPGEFCLHVEREVPRRQLQGVHQVEDVGKRPFGWE